MKKVLFIAAIVFGMAFAANAQDRTIGVHGGYGWELSYQQPMSVGPFTTLDADLGLWGHAFALSATFNNYMPIEGNFSWFYGAGAGIMAESYSGVAWVAPAIVGRLGVQYAFQEIPLTLSLDWKPMINFMIGDVSGFNSYGLYGGGLGIRYRF